jgi:hypothetical protein
MINWQYAMTEAINDASSSVVQVQLGQAQESNSMASLLSQTYSQAYTSETKLLEEISAIEKFYNEMVNDSESDLNKSNYTTFVDDFNNEFGSSVGVKMSWVGDQWPAHAHSHADDYQIQITMPDGSMQTYAGDTIQDSGVVSSVVSEINSSYQEEQQNFSNLEDGSQSSQSDIQNAESSTAKASSNTSTTGASLTQGMGYLSSLLANQS